MLISTSTLSNHTTTYQIELNLTRTLTITPPLTTGALPLIVVLTPMPSSHTADGQVLIYDPEQSHHNSPFEAPAPIPNLTKVMTPPLTSWSSSAYRSTNPKHSHHHSQTAALPLYLILTLVTSSRTQAMPRIVL